MTTTTRAERCTCGAIRQPAAAFCDMCGRMLTPSICYQTMLELVHNDDETALHYERGSHARWVPVSIPQPDLQPLCAHCWLPVRYGFLNIERPGGEEIVVCEGCTDVREAWREED